MDRCLNCETEIVQIVGRKTKVFCGTTCRVQYSRKKNKIEMVSIPKSQLDELLAGQEKIKELMAKTLGYSEERNGSPSNQSDTVKAALIETIADVAPSDLNQKNKSKKVVVAEKVPDTIETPKNDGNEPKWKLRHPVMKVPEKLTGIARAAWIAEWKKQNP